MKYIVTGGAGFIGSHIAQALVKRGKEVVVIDDLSTGREKNIEEFASKIKFVMGSILDKNLLNDIIEEGDVIFHQAALPSVSRSIADPMKTNQVNIEGTLNILTISKENKAKRVIFASSSSVYGDSEKLPKKEKMNNNPKSPYALTKLTGEYYMKLFYTLYGLETVCIRYFNVFGPRQDPDSEYSAVIPKFIKIMKNNEYPVIFGDGEQSRDFSYIENVVYANLLAAKASNAPGEVINVACGEKFTLIDLIKELNKILGKDLRPTYKEERKGDVKHSLADIKKAKKVLKYEPRVNFLEGLKLTVDSFS